MSPMRPPCAGAAWLNDARPGDKGQTGGKHTMSDTTQQFRPPTLVNVLLPFSLADAAGLDESLANGPEGGRRDSGHYARARGAVADLEARDDIPFAAAEQQQRDLVTRVVQALVQDQSTSMAMARAAGVQPEDAGSLGYMTIDDVDPLVGPPEGVPILNQYINVLSVPEPEGGATQVQSALQNVDPNLRVEPVIRVHLVAGLDPFQQGADLQAPMASAYPRAGGDGAGMGDGMGALAPSLDEEELWPEAALESEILSETTPWGITRVNAPRAWALGFTGRGVRVAVVDTGIAPHIDLPRPVGGASFVPGVGSWHDDNGHGTHVAGTIAARRNGRGVIGVAPRCDLLAVKVLSRSGSGSDTSVANGIVWAANNGARVINLSLGSSAASEPIRRALVYARSRKVAVCAAAGNESDATTCRPVGYPARDPLCIAVGATTQTNGKAPFSCCGAELDLAAPGVDVLSTWLGNAYRSLRGTSMATPHMAGAAALALQRAPGLDPARLQRHLERTAVPLGSANQFGRGLVQCDRAVTMPILSVPAEMQQAPIAGMEDVGGARRAAGDGHRRAAGQQQRGAQQQREALRRFGMTDDEVDVWFAFADVAGRILQLPVLHPNERQETVADLHHVQSRLLARAGMRAQGWSRQPAGLGLGGGNLSRVSAADDRGI
jgi:subtilisin family serine protease